MAIVGYNPNITGLHQELLVVFQIAWRENGTAVTRAIATTITFSSVLRVCTNILLIAAILHQKKLRAAKEYLVVAYMAFFDIFDGCWHFCSVTLDYGIQTRFQCLLTIRHLVWFIYAGLTSSLMLAMVSVDRFIAVTFPLWYFEQSTILAHRLAGAVVAAATPFAIYLVSIPLQRPHDLIPYCYTTHTFAEGFDLDGILRRVILSLSIAVYALVLTIHFCKRRLGLAKIGASVGHANDPLWKQFRATQKAVTITMGISAGITLSLNIIPISFWHWLRHAHPHLQQIGWLCFAIVDWSSIANLFLISYRHHEVKTAVIALFKLKQCRADAADRMVAWNTDGVTTIYPTAGRIGTVGRSTMGERRTTNNSQRGRVRRVLI